MKRLRSLPASARLCWAALPLMVCLAAGPARAQSLIELYDAARAYDATFQAARAQGFSEFQVFHLITAPQAIRMSVPSLTNQAILNIKDSSIVFLIQYTEFFAQMQEIALSSFLFFEAYVFTALVYLLLVSVIVVAARWVEGVVSIPRA